MLAAGHHRAVVVEKFGVVRLRPADEGVALVGALAGLQVYVDLVNHGELSGLIANHALFIVAILR